MGRLRSLDGLRGIAALVVLLHHALLISPRFADISVHGEQRDIGSWEWFLTRTPAHIVWAGEEAVLVFFVLSGLVLALPATHRSIRWRSYYPQRLLRLYLPVWGSIVLAAVLLLVVPRDASAERSSWLNLRTNLSAGDGLYDALLVNGVGLLNSPLWSLRWEVIFSLLLPLYLVLARRGARALALKIVVVLGLIAAGTLLNAPGLRFLPVFALGVLMAFHRGALDVAAQWIRTRGRPRLIWSALGALTVVLLTGRWILSGLPIEAPVLTAAASGGSIIGAGLAVLLAIYCPAVRSALERSPAQWVGRRSFSLYLIHEPIVISVAFLLPATTYSWGVIGIAVVAVFAITALFYRTIEAPSHRIAQAVGRRAGGRVVRSSESPGTPPLVGS